MKTIILLAAFVAWLGSNSDLPMPDRAPIIETVSAERIWHMANPGVPFPEDPDDGRVFGAQAADTIYLSDETDLSTVFGQSVLLHEYIHYVQEVEGMDFPCYGQREKHAYMIQKRWLEQQGADLWDHVDPLYTMFVWMIGCGSDYRAPDGSR